MTEGAGTSHHSLWHGAGCPSQKRILCQEARQLRCFTLVTVTAALKAKYYYTESVRKREPVNEEGVNGFVPETPALSWQPRPSAPTHVE